MNHYNLRQEVLRSVVFVGWLVHLFVCWFIRSFVSLHPVTSCNCRRAAGGSAVCGRRRARLADVAPYKNAL